MKRDESRVFEANAANKRGRVQNASIPRPPKPLSGTVVKTSKVPVIVTVACLFIGFALFMYGEWSSGIGFEGLIDRLMFSAGAGLVGVGMFVFGCWYAKRCIADFVVLPQEQKRAALKSLGRQSFAVVSSVVIYGAAFIFVMGGVAALDSASAVTIAVVLIVWAICIAIVVVYRRYRKRHKLSSYRGAGNVALVFFSFLFALAMMFAAFDQGIVGALEDLKEGPHESEVALVDVEWDHATGRYRAFAQDDVVLTFLTPEAERIVLVVPEEDIKQLYVINDSGNFVHLEYYPRTQIYCDATPWPEGWEKMGALISEKIASGEIEVD